MRKATRLALVLLVAAGPGVAASLAKAQATPNKKPSAAPPKTGSSSHHSKSAKHSVKSKGRERGQKAPAPERISEIQQALSKDGSFNSTPNGKWDASTVDAMKKFQEAHGLNPSGKLDAKTLQKLGLGSSTSGMGAPSAPVSASTAANLPSPPVVKQQ